MMNCQNKIIYTVQAGDSLYRLAKRYRTTVTELILGNPSVNPYNLQVGMKLNICPGEEVQTEENAGSVMRGSARIAGQRESGEGETVRNVTRENAYTAGQRGAGAEETAGSVTQTAMSWVEISSRASDDYREMTGETGIDPGERISKTQDSQDPAESACRKPLWPDSPQTEAPASEREAGQDRTGQNRQAETRQHEPQAVTGQRMPEPEQSREAETAAGQRMLEPELQRGAETAAGQRMPGAEQSREAEPIAGQRMSESEQRGGDATIRWRMPEPEQRGGDTTIGQRMPEPERGAETAPGQRMPEPGRQRETGTAARQRMPERQRDAALPGSRKAAESVRDRQNVSDQEPAAPSAIREDIAGKMQVAWLDHVYWLHILLLCVDMDAKERQTAEEVLLQTADEIADAFSLFLPVTAVRQLRNMLNEHVELEGEIIDALRAGRKENYDSLIREWYANQNKMAVLLGEQETYTDGVRKIRNMLLNHLDLTREEIEYQLRGDCQKGVDAFWRVRDQALAMAGWFADEAGAGR